MADRHIERQILRSTFDGKTCWVQPSVARFEERGLAVISLDRLDVRGSDNRLFLVKIT